MGLFKLDLIKLALQHGDDVVEILAALGKALGKASDGGRKVTPEEWSVIKASAELKFRALLETVAADVLDG